MQIGYAIAQPRPLVRVVVSFGGVLILAPLVDAISKRIVRWFSWAGLTLSIVALFVGVRDSSNAITLTCAVNVGAYLVSYFVRLQFMTRLAKSSIPNANIRYFVEEQMVATPTTLLSLFVLSLVGPATVQPDLHAGFTTFFSSPLLGFALLVGLFSQGTGVFGGLILLDKRENTYCVPVNRCSSVLAGVLASYALFWAFDQKTPPAAELTGAALIVGAILFLTVPVMVEKRMAKKRANTL
jgi:hypothetical protein